MMALDRQTRRRLLWGLLFISPWIVGFLWVTLIPIASSFYYSFTAYDLLTPAQFVGLRNYKELLQDKDFLEAVYNTIYFVGLSVPGHVVAGFAVASLLNLNIRLRSLFRTIYYLPSVVPAAASALIWAWIFHAQYGLLNTVLRAIGLPGPMWLADRALVKPALVLVSWWATGSTMVIFLAALQDVPRELYDAAKIDGAGWWSEMRYITISMVTPAILFTLLTGLIGAFSYFTLPYIMTRGGPAGASTFVPQYLYQNAFFWFKMGYASSQAWFMFAITIVVAVLVFKTSARWVFYAGAEK